ncbi:MAG TPA: hypothetical protein EYQ38_00940 [Candidatus Pelagibacter sp.]|nr:hypothetical protein [Candidatus Pelagibacter sp.]
MTLYRRIAEAKLSKEEASDKVSILHAVVIKVRNWLTAKIEDMPRSSRPSEEDLSIVFYDHIKAGGDLVPWQAISRLEGTEFVWEHFKSLMVKWAIEEYYKESEAARPEPQEQASALDPHLDPAAARPPVPDYDPSMGRGVKDFMGDFVSRFYTPDIPALLSSVCPKM